MEEDELDPRIQVELEKLNSATDVINKLEIELDEANTTFRVLLNECTRRLKVHSSKHGSAIENARPYYEALEIARKAQQDCQQAAVNFQRANEVHEAAKETVALAESRFMSQQPEWRFDSAWQEMLNHATIKVRDAEKQRAESSTYHSEATARYKEAQEKVQLLEQRLRRNVAKSRPYFEEKQRCNEQLSAQKEAVEALAAKVTRVKSEYAESLRRLEDISEEIHRRRGNRTAGVREPGVGAELVYKGEHAQQAPAFHGPGGPAEGGDVVEGGKRVGFGSLEGRHSGPGGAQRDPFLPSVGEGVVGAEGAGDTEGGGGREARSPTDVDGSCDRLASLGLGETGDADTRGASDGRGHQTDTEGGHPTDAEGGHPTEAEAAASTPKCHDGREGPLHGHTDAQRRDLGDSALAMSVDGQDMSQVKEVPDKPENVCDYK